jgi:hypothetical protein
MVIIVAKASSPTITIPFVAATVIRIHAPRDTVDSWFANPAEGGSSANRYTICTGPEGAEGSVNTDSHNVEEVHGGAQDGAVLGDEDSGSVVPAGVINSSNQPYTSAKSNIRAPRDTVDS